MSIIDCGNSNDKVKNSIDLIRSRIKQKKQSAIDLFDRNDDNKPLKEKLESNMTENDVAQNEAVRVFQVIHNEVYADVLPVEVFNDSSKWRDKNKGGIREGILYNNDMTSGYVPIVQKIITSKGV